MMLVYADCESRLSALQVLSELKRRSREPPAAGLAEQRTLLILAGQLEQAACDGEVPWACQAQRLTDLIASTFVRTALRRASKAVAGPAFEAALAGLETAVRERPLRSAIKIPEGFAWYAVYPDAYLATALAWSSRRARSERVLVIGLRSIGTCLAAVVKAALQARGFDPERLSVRPGGHPFHRTVHGAFGTPVPDAAIIVDEGPGLSGSSMAAVASALSCRGLSERAMYFFPAHLNGPGPMASAEVRQCWSAVEALASPLEDLSIGGTTLEDHLIGSTPGADKSRLINLGGGKWVARTGIPAVSVTTLAPQLELPKYLVEGSDTATLWKFAGLTLVPHSWNGGFVTSCEATEARLDRLRGFVPGFLGAVHGWIGSKWVRGRRLSPRDISPHRIAHVAAYLRRAAEPALGPESDAVARERLAGILLENTAELLGEAALSDAHYACDLLLNERRTVELPAYGDGRMAPHEWVEIAEGAMLKTDAGGHAFDHTAVGPQCVLWDAAGVIIEWQLPRIASVELLERLGFAPSFDPLLCCYCAAYAAFRGGVAWLCGANATRAFALAFYRKRLMSELQYLRSRRN